LLNVREAVSGPVRANRAEPHPQQVSAIADPPLTFAPAEFRRSTPSHADKAFTYTIASPESSSVGSDPMHPHRPRPPLILSSRHGLGTSGSLPSGMSASQAHELHSPPPDAPPGPTNARKKLRADLKTATGKLIELDKALR
jgi:hypothetical protein